MKRALRITQEAAFNTFPGAGPTSIWVIRETISWALAVISPPPARTRS